MKNIRLEFANTMLEVGQKNPDLIVLVSDISHGILKTFAQKCPGQFYNVGICEQSVVNMAAGLSKINLIPVVHTIAPFIVERSYEQIKLDFGYQRLGVNIITVGGSFDYSQLGCSHHCYADVSLMSHFARSSIFIPGTPKEFNLLFKENYNNGRINYFRISNSTHDIDVDENVLKSSKGILIKKGTDVTIVTIGPQLQTAIKASEKLLKEKSISAEIIYFPTLKPFDYDLVRTSVKKTKKLISFEELSAHDGLFNLCIKSTIGIKDILVDQIAIKDFIHEYGSFEDLCTFSGLTVENLYKKVILLLAKK
jgi:transketolase